MQTITQSLTKTFGDAFSAAGYDAAHGRVDYSNRPDLCQFSCSGAMAAAKQYKKNPAVIANEVINSMDSADFTAEFAPPGFINITLTDDALARRVDAMRLDARHGIPLMDRRKLVLDYGGANIAKPLHVGHMRPAIIGEAMKRLARYLGHDVVGDAHLGDWGRPLGLVIAAIKERPDQDFTLDELNEIYPQANARAESDAEFKDKAAAYTAALQSGDPEVTALWRRIVAASVADIKKTYGVLNVDFDVWYGESDANPYVPEVSELLREKGLLYLSDGAYVVDVKQESDAANVPPILITKSNGAALYATTDLACVLQRIDAFSPDEIWYFVDTRQSLHFTQVFRCIRLMGFGEDKLALFHANNGTMNGADGKPYKTRDGGVPQLNDLIKLVTEAAYAKITESNFAADCSEDEKQGIAQKVGVAALKFGDLINHRAKDYIFDVDRFVSFEGKTGPYVLYTIVRINSLLDRCAQFERGGILPPSDECESKLMLILTMAGDALLQAFRDKTPNCVAEYAFDLSCAVNRFYAEHHVMTERDPAKRGSRLSLLALSRDIMSACADILGLDVPERM